MTNTSFNLPETLALARQQHQAGQLQKAQQLYQQVLQAEPDNAEANHLLGVLAYQVGQHNIAAPLISRAILKNSNQAPYYNNLALVLQAQGQLEQASKVFEQALVLDPGYADAHNNLGIVLENLGRFEEALATHEKAIAANPDHANAHNSRGLVLHKLGRLELAQQAFKRAITLDSAFGEAHNNLGNTLEAQGKIGEALKAYQQAITLQPDHARAFSNLLLCMNYDACTDAQSLFTAHQQWNQRFLSQQEPAHTNPADPDRRLRIGYVSADFYGHPVASFIEPILASHDHQAVEVICYTNNAWRDEVTERLQALADKWQNIAGMSDEQVAGLIRDDAIDILIDLSGHTAGNRLQVFACKPAPVQVSYLGYPGSSGLTTMDYRISDEWLDPAGLTEAFHTEKIIRLPHGSLCFKPSGQDPGLDEMPTVKAGEITFASFNNTAKITPETVALWSRILEKVPGSRLLLKSRSLRDASTRERLKAMFSENGIEAQRLEFVGWTASFMEHLELYRRVHIGLDTFPYSGCTTTCEALWMGVPVITLARKETRSRMGVGVLNQAGLDELIADSQEAYIELASKLASDSETLRAMRTGIRQKVSASSLFDASTITASLEGAYRDMWKHWCASRVKE